MKKWIAILSGLLVAQLVLALSLNLVGEDYGAFEPQEKLLAFDAQTVDELRIEDGTDSVVLSKQDGRWVLPESGDFPADQGTVDRLLDALAELEKGWPVGTTAGAAKRFKVDDDAFERRLSLGADDKTQAALYVGTSPGFRKVHVRPEGEDAVYAVAFNTWEANAAADDWIDKDILKLDVNEIERVELPAVTLQRDGDTVRVMDLTDQEETNAQEANALLGRVAAIQIQSVLGTEAKPEYRQDAPQLELEVMRKGGDVLTYRISKPEDATFYVLKRSDLDYYFKLAEFMVEPIEKTQRDQLVKAQAGTVPGAAVQGESPDEAAAETAPGDAPEGEETPGDAPDDDAPAEVTE